MINVKVYMRVTKQPLKRTAVVLQRDVDNEPTETVPTDRLGIARFDLPPGTGKVLVAGIERFHGRLDGDIDIGLWSLTQASDDDAGDSGVFPSGSNAYPGMSTRMIQVDGRNILTDHLYGALHAHPRPAPRHARASTREALSRAASIAT